MKIAGEILAALPTNEWSPETTDGMQGFVHPVSLNGIAEKAGIGFIVRDFNTTGESPCKVEKTGGTNCVTAQGRYHGICRTGAIPQYERYFAATSAGSRLCSRSHSAYRPYRY